MDEQTVSRLRALITQRDLIDNELSNLISGAAPKKSVRCSICDEVGHNKNTCPGKQHQTTI